MESVVKSLWIGFGAFIGANARFWLGELIGHRAFPWTTLAINILGSLIIGVFYAWELKNAPAIASRLFIAVGICGGFTTFSAFSWETLRLLEKGDWLAGGAYVISTVVLTIVACSAGFFLTRSILGG